MRGAAFHRGRVRASHPAALGPNPGIAEIFSSQYCLVRGQSWEIHPSSVKQGCHKCSQRWRPELSTTKTLAVNVAERSNGHIWTPQTQVWFPVMTNVFSTSATFSSDVSLFFLHDLLRKQKSFFPSASLSISAHVVQFLLFSMFSFLSPSLSLSLHLSLSLS